MMNKVVILQGVHNKGLDILPFEARFTLRCVSLVTNVPFQIFFIFCFQNSHLKQMHSHSFVACRSLSCCNMSSTRVDSWYIWVRDICLKNLYHLLVLRILYGDKYVSCV